MRACTRSLAFTCTDTALACAHTPRTHTRTHTPPSLSHTHHTAHGTHTRHTAHGHGLMTRVLDATRILDAAHAGAPRCLATWS
jgi:hypothetical protein